MKIIDLHCDTISRLEESGQEETLAGNSFHVDLNKLEEGGYLLQTFAMFVDKARYPDAYGRCRRLLARFEKEMEQNKDRIGPVKTYGSLLKNEAGGRLSALLSIEEGAVCQADISKPGEFYDRGVRMMTLTWNYKNGLAYPNHLPEYERGCAVMEPDRENGLTETGILFVEEMERLSMIIDLSHLGDKGIQDVLAHTKGPVIASHSNARALCGHVRNLPDDLIRRIADRGGVIGVNFYPAFLCGACAGREPESKIDGIISHMKHLVRVGGIGCVALGTDFDGMTGNLEIADASMMQRLPEEMERQGFSHTETEKICYQNARRLLREMLPA